VAIDRFSTRLAKHAITHPVGAMLAHELHVGGVLARFPELRVAFFEAGAGWLPFWLERLDEHWSLMPEQAPSSTGRRRSTSRRGSCRASPRTNAAVGDRHPRDGVVCYASDYWHWDCSFPDSVKLLVDRSICEDARSPCSARTPPPLWAPPPRIGQTGVMTITEANPTAVHVGADELPFVDIGDGNKSRSSRSRARRPVDHRRTSSSPASRSDPPSHRAGVGLHSSGGWKYKEYDYVNRAGSFLYEPAGSVHTLTASRPTRGSGSTCTART